MAGLTSLAVAAAIGGSPTPLHVPATAALRPAPTSVRLTASQLLGIVDRLIKSGRPDEAREMLALLAKDPDPDIRNEARYRQSLVLETKGRDREAAVLLRRIVDDKPDAAPVRLKLATMLTKMGDQDSALRELRAIRSADLPLQVARFVDRLAASLQATKPFGVHLEVAVAPDSNINRATRSETVGTVFGDFKLDQEARSGIGASIRGFAHARQGITDNLNLLARLSGDASLYRHKDFNDIQLELSVGPELSIGRNRVTAEVAVGQHWFGMKPYQRNFRIGASIARPVDSVSHLRLDLGVRRTDNRLNDLQDGRGFHVRARYERALSPQMIVSASIGGDRFKARDDAYSTKSWSAGLAAYRDIGRMTFSAGVEIGRLKADDRLSLLPEAREDRLTRFHLGTVFRQFSVGGFAPMTRIIMERNKSSVEFYDYKRTRTEVGVSRAF